MRWQNSQKKRNCKVLKGKCKEIKWLSGQFFLQEDCLGVSWSTKDWKTLGVTVVNWCSHQPRRSKVQIPLVEKLFARIFCLLVSLHRQSSGCFHVTGPQRPDQLVNEKDEKMQNTT